MNAGKHLAQAPVATFVDLFHGHKALQAFYKQDANARSIATITDQIIQGGGGVGWDRLHHDNMVESFMRALRQGNVWGAAWRTVPMFFEAVQKPIMDWWVPRLKLGAYLDLAAMELRTLGEPPTSRRCVACSAACGTTSTTASASCATTICSGTTR
jgi:hypothetical protein